MCIDNGGTRAKLHRLLSKGEISKGKNSASTMKIFLDDESIYGTIFFLLFNLRRAFEIYIFLARIIISYACTTCLTLPM